VSSRRNPTPSYLLHRQSGRARAVWTDPTGTRCQRLLPGQFNSRESKAAFAQIVAEVAADPHIERDRDRVSVAEVLLAFLDFAEGHYVRPDGSQTHEVAEYKLVSRYVRELYGETLAREFGPLALKAVRERFITAGWCRSLVNRRVIMPQVVEPNTGPLPGERPGDHYDRVTDIHDVLCELGFVEHSRKRVGQTLYTRPGKKVEDGCSASVLGNSLWLFSSAVPWLKENEKHGHNKPYTPFGLLVALKHKGNASAAARELAQQGYGDRPKLAKSASHKRYRIKLMDNGRWTSGF
jgi:hypothetical protein